MRKKEKLQDLKQEKKKKKTNISKKINHFKIVK